MDVHPERHERRQQPEPARPPEAMFGQDRQKAGEDWEGVALRAHQPVVERDRQRRQQQQRNAQPQPPAAHDAQPEQQAVGERDDERLGQQDQREAAGLIQQVHQDLRQPALVVERPAGLGVGEAVEVGDRAVLHDQPAGGHVPPEVVGRDGGQQRAQREQRERCREPDVVERKGQEFCSLWLKMAGCSAFKCHGRSPDDRRTPERITHADGRSRPARRRIRAPSADRSRGQRRAVAGGCDRAARGERRTCRSTARCNRAPRR